MKPVHVLEYYVLGFSLPVFAESAQTLSRLSAGGSKNERVGFSDSALPILQSRKRQTKTPINKMICTVKSEIAKVLKGMPSCFPKNSIAFRQNIFLP